MAWADLSQAEQETVAEFFRDYRSAIGDLVRSLRTQDLLTDTYTQNVAPLWSQIANGDEIPDGNGLANSGVMTKADWTPILGWSTDVLDGLYDATGGAVATVWPDSDTVDQYGVNAAGPTNI